MLVPGAAEEYIADSTRQRRVKNWERQLSGMYSTPARRKFIVFAQHLTCLKISCSLGCSDATLW